MTTPAEWAEKAIDAFDTGFDDPHESTAAKVAAIIEEAIKAERAECIAIAERLADEIESTEGRQEMWDGASQVADALKERDTPSPDS